MHGSNRYEPTLLDELLPATDPQPQVCGGGSRGQYLVEHPVTTRSSAENAHRFSAAQWTMKPG